jgi:hypothetical protein
MVAGAAAPGALAHTQRAEVHPWRRRTVASAQHARDDRNLDHRHGLGGGGVVRRMRDRVGVFLGEVGPQGRDTERHGRGAKLLAHRRRQRAPGGQRIDRRPRFNRRG